MFRRHPASNDARGLRDISLCYTLWQGSARCFGEVASYVVLLSGPC